MSRLRFLRPRLPRLRPRQKRSTRAAGARVTGILRAPRLAALVTIAVLVAAASLTSFAESYRGLFDWAREHGLSGVWAAVWPLQIDVFIAVGELALFIALVDAWNRRSRAGAWTVTLLGLAVSVAGNVGHVTGHSLTNRATAAVPPLAAAAALAAGLGVLKRVVEAHHQAATEDASEHEDLPAMAPPVAPAVIPAVIPVPEAGPERLAAWLITGNDPGPRAHGLNGRGHPSAHEPLPGSIKRALPAGATESGGRPRGSRSRTRSPGAPAKRSRSAPVSTGDAEREFMGELASGAVPSLRSIRSRMHVGPDRAKALREHLASVIPAAQAPGRGDQ